MSDDIEPTTEPQASEGASEGTAQAEVQDDIIRNDEQLVEVYSTADATAGMMAKSLLEAQGIPVFIKGSATDQAYPTSGTFIFVGQDDAARADAILAEADKGAFELAEGEDPEAAG